METYLSAAAGETAGLMMPSPEDIFLTWMFSLPDGADLPQAARLEVARIDGAGRTCAKLLRLRGLFHQATATPAQPAMRRQRRLRH